MNRKPAFKNFEELHEKEKQEKKKKLIRSYKLRLPFIKRRIAQYLK